MGKLLEHRHTSNRPLQRLAKLTPVRSEKAQLSIADGHTRPITQLLLDGQGPAVPLLCLTKPPLILRHHAKLVIGEGQISTGFFRARTPSYAARAGTDPNTASKMPSPQTGSFAAISVPRSE